MYFVRSLDLGFWQTKVTILILNNIFNKEVQTFWSDCTARAVFTAHRVLGCQKIMSFCCVSGQWVASWSCLFLCIEYPKNSCIVANFAILHSTSRPQRHLPEEEYIPKDQLRMKGALCSDVPHSFTGDRKHASFGISCLSLAMLIFSRGEQECLYFSMLYLPTITTCYLFSSYFRKTMKFLFPSSHFLSCLPFFKCGFSVSMFFLFLFYRSPWVMADLKTNAMSWVWEKCLACNKIQLGVYITAFQIQSFVLLLDIWQRKPSSRSAGNNISLPETLLGIYWNSATTICFSRFRFKSVHCLLYPDTVWCPPLKVKWHLV